MNGIHNRKGQGLQKPFPGCMGRMINIFDLSMGMGMAGTKLLTEKAHLDGSPICKNRSGSPIRKNQPDVVKKAIDTIRVQIEDKPRAGDLRKCSSTKLGGTPMKMLIAQEMSREIESKRKQPNVVARLMGLDALPVHQSVPTARSISQEGYCHNTSAGEFLGYWQQEDGSYHNPLQCDAHSCIHEKKYKDVYEVWHQPSRTSRVQDQPPQNGRFNENPTEKRMTLILQKFIEEKSLATDEKLLQSEEFQDALEVLSSNRDLFLKFLEEPNSLFSKHLQELQAVSPLSQTKRITVLKPSKTAEAKGERQVKKQVYPTAEDIDCNMNQHKRNSSFTRPKAGSISQPTRIVVLKPGPGKPNEMKTMVASPMPSSKLMEGRDLYGGLGTNEAMGPREVAREITRQMQECLSSNQRDEALISSAISNGYVGDESSFNRSQNDCIEEECGNFSDSETVTPTSWHSWDCINRFGSPYSVSSFCQASYSPESSVIKEAKKRLSERWAMVASNGIGQEQIQVWRSSSSLGEMLAIPEVKKEEEEEGNDMITISSSGSSGERDLNLSAACLSLSGTKDGCSWDNSLRNLSRSKYVPVSASVYENIELNEEAPDSLIRKSIVPEEVAKSKNGKSSFKGKVSSLFFSRIKKPGREKAIPSMIDNSEREENSGKASSPPTLLNSPKQGTFSVKGSLSLEKPRTSENSRENQDQPIPISVLDAIAGHPPLSRSAPIESIARTLSWDDTHLGTSIPNSLKLSRVLSKECEEQKLFAFVEKLLSSASLDNESSSRVLARWHSLDSPLDPMLLDDFLDRKEEEAKCRERRSNQRLLFDCVNAALLEIGRAAIVRTYSWSRDHVGAWKEGRACAPLTEEVRKLVRDWFSGEGNRESSEAENRNQVLDGVVKREVAGSRWAESMWLEIDEFSKEIGGEVLEELVEEALADLNVGCLC